MSITDSNTGKESYYLIDTTKKYELSNPSPLDNLLAMYGLEPVARSLARTNPDGSKGVKLRKSYKNHIQDLPGRHQIPNAKAIPGALLDPSIPQAPDIITSINSDLLDRSLNFEKTPLGGIPGFNAADLAINDQQTLMRGDYISENEEPGSKKGKRKKKALYGGDLKKQHI